MTEPTDPFSDWLAGRPVEPLSPRPGDFDRIARSARRRRFLRAAATGAAVLLVVAGVIAVLHPVSGPAVGPGATPTASASRLPPTSAPTSSAPAAVGPTGPGRCGVAHLRITLVPGDSAAGHLGLRLVLTNTSAGPCTLFGYPGVSFVDSPDGAAVNDPAQPAGGPAEPVTLVPGAAAHADLLLTQVGNFPAASCHPVTVAGARVNPPNETATVFVASAQQLCSARGTGVPQLYPVQPG